jgi:hypothetical protein
MAIGDDGEAVEEEEIMESDANDDVNRGVNIDVWWTDVVFLLGVVE